MRHEKWKDEHGRVSHKVTITIEDIRKRFRLPDDAKVCFTVPGGADWSGMSVPLDENVEPLIGRWHRME